MTITVGIISSFDILCGNATYSEQLAQGIEKRGYEVIRIAVPDTIQKEEDCAAIKNIIRQASQCSIVNIQMELGLYGSNPNVSSKNLVKIINSLTMPTTVTVHRVDKRPNSYLRMLKNNMTAANFLTSLFFTTKTYFKQLYLYRSYRRIFNRLQRKSFKVITHTLRDKDFIKKYYDTNSVLHPIFWPESLVTESAEKRQHSGIEVGIFGFISPHKNFSVVVDAFSYLLKGKQIPENSRLVIYGGHHPEAPGYGARYNYTIDLIDTKLKKISLIEKLSPTEVISRLINLRKLTNVDWIVGADDYEMATAISQVDVCVIPYMETGQSGSGITSQSIQFAKRIVMSDTKMTQQHQQICDGKIIIFDTSSVVSLASAILRALKTNATPRFKKEFSYERLIDILIYKDQINNNSELMENRI